MTHCRMFLALVLVLPSSFTETITHEVAFDGAVAVLEDYNFQEWVSWQPLTVVLFHAPWCAHCKNFEPEWEAAAIGAQALEPPIHLAKIDVAANPIGTRRLTKDKTLPLLMEFRHGEAFEYPGPRLAMPIVEYLGNSREPLFDLVESLTELDVLLANNEFVAIAILEQPLAASLQYDTWVKTLTALQDGDWQLEQPVCFALEAGTFYDHNLGGKVFSSVRKSMKWPHNPSRRLGAHPSSDALEPWMDNTITSSGGTGKGIGLHEGPDILVFNHSGRHRCGLVHSFWTAAYVRRCLEKYTAAATAPASQSDARK